jgi:protein-L-isoaspartate O-methyltransferase
VRHIISDDNRYYCWSKIEERRTAMLHAPKPVKVLDYGSRGQGKVEERLVCDIAKTSLESAKNGQLFFRIVNWLGHEKGAPLRIVELGTNLGITTAYLALPDSRNKVITFEGSEELLAMAELNWRKLGVANVEAVSGNIDDTLNTYAREKIDVVYMDANHRKEPTLRYFETLLPCMGEKSIVIIDDIHHSPEMEEAWKAIGERAEVTTTMDYYDFGIVFFDRHYLKRHYKLRV